ncbi:MULTISPECIES: HupE/UreJ family protein [unclassified Synechococcus]|uniref:HupE/UreJ family protein n=1 Tax=unclassified Synechococcus TaxID=2626047 RepID=UPI0020CC17AE|nr:MULTISPECIES: HupE/UreJ family protein [unclassified Synechococcus]
MTSLSGDPARLRQPARPPQHAHRPTQSTSATSGSRRITAGPIALLGLVPLLLVSLLAAPASAHHLMEVFGLREGAMAGFLSGLGHPLLGPDHLLFLLSLGLVGLQQPLRWVIALLTIGLGSTALGLVLPVLPGSELLVALSLVATGLVVLGRWPSWILLPAIALHGSVLSQPVLGWSISAQMVYLLGLLLSQGALLITAVTLVRSWARRLQAANLRLLAGLLIGIGATFAWTQLVP